MPSFLTKVFGRKKDGNPDSPSSGELLDGKFEDVSPTESPSAAEFPELKFNGSPRGRGADRTTSESTLRTFFRSRSRAASPVRQQRQPKKIDDLPPLLSLFTDNNNDGEVLLTDKVIAERRLTPVEAVKLVQACSQVICNQGLETLGIMNPHWYSGSPETQQRLISLFIQSLTTKSPLQAYPSFDSEINSTQSPYDVAAVLRWGLRHLQLQGNDFGLAEDWYQTFFDEERKAKYPPKAFSDILTPLIPSEHFELLKEVLEIFTSLAAHAETNSTSASKLSKVYGLWLLNTHRVETKDDWKSFYDRWEVAGRQLEHVLFAQIRNKASEGRFPKRLVELVRKYPYGVPTTDQRLLPRPKFTTRLEDALLVRVTTEVSSETRIPKNRVHPLRLIADALSSTGEANEFTAIWTKIVDISKAEGTGAPLSRILSEDSIRLLSLLPEPEEENPKSPALGLLPLSPASPKARRLSWSLSEFTGEMKRTTSQQSQTTVASPLSPISADWSLFSTSGFGTTPTLTPLSSALFSTTEVERTSPPSRKPSTRHGKETSSAGSSSHTPRKSVDFVGLRTPEERSIPEESAEPSSTISLLQIVQLDEAFVDFWSDALLDPVAADWPSFVVCRLKSSIVPGLKHTTAEGVEKTLRWVILEQQFSVKPPPPAPPAPVVETLSETLHERPSSPATSLGKKRFAFWTASRSNSSASVGSTRNKDRHRKERSGRGVSEMGEVLEETVGSTPRPDTERRASGASASTIGERSRRRVSAAMENVVRVRMPSPKPRKSTDVKSRKSMDATLAAEASASPTKKEGDSSPAAGAAEVAVPIAAAAVVVAAAAVIVTKEDDAPAMETPSEAAPAPDAQREEARPPEAVPTVDEKATNSKVEPSNPDDDGEVVTAPKSHIPTPSTESSALQDNSQHEEVAKPAVLQAPIDGEDVAVHSPASPPGLAEETVREDNTVAEGLAEAIASPIEVPRAKEEEFVVVGEEDDVVLVPEVVEEAAVPVEKEDVPVHDALGTSGTGEPAREGVHVAGEKEDEGNVPQSITQDHVPEQQQGEDIILQEQRSGDSILEERMEEAEQKEEGTEALKLAVEELARPEEKFVAMQEANEGKTFILEAAEEVVEWTAVADRSFPAEGASDHLEETVVLDDEQELLSGVEVEEKSHLVASQVETVPVVEGGLVDASVLRVEEEEEEEEEEEKLPISGPEEPNASVKEEQLETRAVEEVEVEEEPSVVTEEVQPQTHLVEEEHDVVELPAPVKPAVIAEDDPAVAQIEKDAPPIEEDADVALTEQEDAPIKEEEAPVVVSEHGESGVFTEHPEESTEAISRDEESLVPLAGDVPSLADEIHPATEDRAVEVDIPVSAAVDVEEVHNPVEDVVQIDETNPGVVEQQIAQEEISEHENHASCLDEEVANVENEDITPGAEAIKENVEAVEKLHDVVVAPEDAPLDSEDASAVPGTEPLPAHATSVSTTPTDDIPLKQDADTAVGAEEVHLSVTDEIKAEPLPGQTIVEPTANTPVEVEETAPFPAEASLAADEEGAVVVGEDAALALENVGDELQESVTQVELEEPADGAQEAIPEADDAVVFDPSENSPSPTGGSQHESAPPVVDHETQESPADDDAKVEEVEILEIPEDVTVAIVPVNETTEAVSEPVENVQVEESSTVQPEAEAEEMRKTETVEDAAAEVAVDDDRRSEAAQGSDVEAGEVNAEDVEGEQIEPVEEKQTSAVDEAPESLPTHEESALDDKLTADEVIAAVEVSAVEEPKPQEIVGMADRADGDPSTPEGNERGDHADESEPVEEPRGGESASAPAGTVQVVSEESEVRDIAAVEEAPVVMVVEESQSGDIAVVDEVTVADEVAVAGAVEHQPVEDAAAVEGSAIQVELQEAQAEDIAAVEDIVDGEAVEDARAEDEAAVEEVAAVVAATESRAEDSAVVAAAEEPREEEVPAVENGEVKPFEDSKLVEEVRYHNDAAEAIERVIESPVGGEDVVDEAKAMADEEIVDEDKEDKEVADAHRDEVVTVERAQMEEINDASVSEAQADHAGAASEELSNVLEHGSEEECDLAVERPDDSPAPVDDQSFFRVDDASAPSEDLPGPIGGLDKSTPVDEELENDEQPSRMAVEGPLTPVDPPAEDHSAQVEELRTKEEYPADPAPVEHSTEPVDIPVEAVEERAAVTPVEDAFSPVEEASVAIPTEEPVVVLEEQPARVYDEELVAPIVEETSPEVEHIAAEEAPVPVEESTAPAEDRKDADHEEPSAPLEEGPTPVEEESSPLASEACIAIEESVAPLVEAIHTPVEDIAVEGVSAVVQELSAPASDTCIADEEEPIATLEETVAQVEETAAEEAPAPVEEASAPAEARTGTDHEEHAASLEEAHAPIEGIADNEEPAPTEESSAPASEARIAVEEPAPPLVEEAPTPAQVIVGEEIPAPVEDIAPKEGTPLSAPAETFVADEGPTAALVAEPPTPVESITVEEAPAQVEEPSPAENTIAEEEPVAPLAPLDDGPAPVEDISVGEAPSLVKDIAVQEIFAPIEEPSTVAEAGIAREEPAAAHEEALDPVDDLAVDEAPPSVEETSVPAEEVVALPEEDPARVEQTLEPTQRNLEPVGDDAVLCHVDPHLSSGDCEREASPADIIESAHSTAPDSPTAADIVKAPVETEEAIVENAEETQTDAEKVQDNEVADERPQETQPDSSLVEHHGPTEETKHEGLGEGVEIQEASVEGSPDTAAHEATLKESTADPSPTNEATDEVQLTTAETSIALPAPDTADPLAIGPIELSAAPDVESPVPVENIVEETVAQVDEIEESPAVVALPTQAEDRLGEADDAVATEDSELDAPTQMNDAANPDIVDEADSVIQGPCVLNSDDVPIEVSTEHSEKMSQEATIDPVADDIDLVSNTLQSDVAVEDVKVQDPMDAPAPQLPEPVGITRAVDSGDVESLAAHDDRVAEADNKDGTEVLDAMTEEATSTSKSEPLEAVRDGMIGEQTSQTATQESAIEAEDTRVEEAQPQDAIITSDAELSPAPATPFDRVLVEDTSDHDVDEPVVESDDVTLLSGVPHIEPLKTGEDDASNEVVDLPAVPLADNEIPRSPVVDTLVLEREQPETIGAHEHSHIPEALEAQHLPEGLEHTLEAGSTPSVEALLSAVHHDTVSNTGTSTEKSVPAPVDTELARALADADDLPTAIENAYEIAPSAEAIVEAVQATLLATHFPPTAPATSIENQEAVKPTVHVDAASMTPVMNGNGNDAPVEDINKGVAPVPGTEDHDVGSAVIDDQIEAPRDVSASLSALGLEEAVPAAVVADLSNPAEDARPATASETVAIAVTEQLHDTAPAAHELVSTEDTNKLPVGANDTGALIEEGVTDLPTGVAIPDGSKST